MNDSQNIENTSDDPFPENIFDVPYTSVLNKFEYAHQNIALPAHGGVLIVENGGSLKLSSGNCITLKPGFHAMKGSRLIAKTNPNIAEEIVINVSSWINVFTPNGDGVNDYLTYSVKNANHWDFEAYTRSGKLIFQNSGTIYDNTANVWDGTNSNGTAFYRCVVKFSNEYDRYISNDYFIYIYKNKSSKDFSSNEDNFLFGTCTSTDDVDNLLVRVFPNPTSNQLYIVLNNISDYKKIELFSVNGNLLFSNSNISSLMSINMSNYPHGVYLLKVFSVNCVNTTKVIHN